MHYRNGREAKNGDKIVKLNERGEVVTFGILHSATPGNDYLTLRQVRKDRNTFPHLSQFEVKL